MEKHPDENDRHRNGTLPHDPFEDAEDFKHPAESTAPPPRASGTYPTIALTTAKELAEPLPDLTYLVPHLGLAPGAPVLVAGYGFAGKTVSLQSLALSIASGRPVWGVYSCRRGRVLHLDFEQGRRVTQERYQRLARAMKIDLATLENHLTVAINPAVYLDDVVAPAVYGRLFEGYSLVIVDSLRAAAPKSDENASDVRTAIDTMSRAAEAHQALLVFVHHARKPKADDPAGARYKIRGSSALFDACGSVFVYSAEKGQATRVTHEKCRNRGIPISDFGLQIEDVELDGDARKGLEVTHLEPEQLAAEQAAGPSSHTEALERIGDFLKTEGEVRGSKSTLCERLRMNRNRFFAAIDELESRGDIEMGRDERGAFVRWTGPDARAQDI